MDKCYIAVNGDNVGQGIGNAVASDDYEGLGQLSNTIKESHSMIEEWVQSKGGEVVTSTGDEGIYAIPIDACEELEGIKSQYQEMSQNTLTIGVGSSMSEASKALIYGKLNEKNQIVEYFPEIESYLSEDDVNDIPEGELPETEEIGDERDTGLEEEAGLPPEGAEELPPEMGDEGMEKLPPEGMEEGLEPEHEEDMPPEENFEHDAQENMDDEIDPDIIEADEEGVDGTLPEDTSPDEMGAEMGEELPPEEGLEPEHTMSGDLGEEELPPEGMEEGEDGERYDVLSNMIHGHLGDEEGGEEGEMSEDDVNAELKNDIFNALQGFKNNREMLEQAKQENPELYQSLITMLSSMIQMAKQVNYNPEEDLADEEVQAGIEEGFPESGEEEMDEEIEEEMPEDMQDDVEEEMGEEIDEEGEVDPEEDVEEKPKDVKKKPKIM